MEKHSHWENFTSLSRSAVQVSITITRLGEFSPLYSKRVQKIIRDATMHSMLKLLTSCNVLIADYQTLRVHQPLQRDPRLTMISQISTPEPIRNTSVIAHSLA